MSKTLIIASVLAVSLSAVSYTHLDVYKETVPSPSPRQAAGPSPANGPATMHTDPAHLVTDAAALQALYGEPGEASLKKEVCLLYTSRCV